MCKIGLDHSWSKMFLFGFKELLFIYFIQGLEVLSFAAVEGCVLYDFKANTTKNIATNNECSLSEQVRAQKALSNQRAAFWGSRDTDVNNMSEKLFDRRYSNKLLHNTVAIV